MATYEPHRYPCTQAQHEARKKPISIDDHRFRNQCRMMFLEHFKHKKLQEYLKPMKKTKLYENAERFIEHQNRAGRSLIRHVKAQIWQMDNQNRYKSLGRVGRK